MPYVKVTLAKHATADGVDMVREDVPIGKSYEMLIESVKEMRWMDASGAITKRVSAFFVDETEEGGIMPVELFNIPSDVLKPEELYEGET